MSDIFEKIKLQLQHHAQDMFDFASEIIKIESLSGHEGQVAKCITQKMQELGFNDITEDAMGNVRGSVGSGPRIVCVDGHMDTVGIGSEDAWLKPPYSGIQDDDFIYGRGAADMKAALAAMLYAGKVVQELELAKDITFMVCATVQEEPCEGLAWEYLIEREGVRPDFVILAEPSSDMIALGQKGRMEIKISVQGKTAHASTPERGLNAIYLMANIVLELQSLNENLDIVDEDLGKGALVVSEISAISPSRNSVPEYCEISIDRRLTWGESPHEVLEQIRKLKSVQEAEAVVSVFCFDNPSYTGLIPEKECSFPAWKIEKEHAVTRSVAHAYTKLFAENPRFSTWPFSTNGSGIMGKHGIPVIGYGPGELLNCHVPNECVAKEQVLKAAMLFAGTCVTYAKTL